ncbi:MAG: SpoIVB peptidase S55 domain-containing protein, partial [Butyricicoccaceae bacterium]
MKKQIRLACCMLMLTVLLTAQSLAALLIPIGRPAGVCMTSQGVIVSALTGVETASGTEHPAEKAGIQPGDILLTANGQELSSGEQLAELSAAGKELKLTGLREDKPFTVCVKPAKSQQDHCWRVGLLVRDSMAGIGTITYVDPADGTFGALGHAVCDVDSGVRLPLSSGLLTPAE